MATLQKIRNRGTLLILILGLALFTFILGGAIQNSSTYFAHAANIVGEIDGEAISYEDFRQQVSINMQEQENQRGGLSSAQRDAVEQQTWNQMVERKVLGKQIKSLGIAVTADELSHIFANKTDRTVQEVFGNATQEQIANRVAEIEASKNNAQKAQLNAFKEYIIGKRTNEKYFSLLTQGLEVNRSIMEEADAKGKVSFKYIMRSYSSIADSTVEVTVSEIKDYYKKHQNLFKQVPAREVAYVKIDVEPSKEDKDFAMKTMEELVPKFEGAKDVFRFAVVNSEIEPSSVYLKKDEIADKDLAEFAFSGENGVFGPYGADNILQITRVADKKMMPDSVRASHILIPFTENTQAKVDSLLSLLDKGADFATLAKENSMDKNSAVNGGDLGWFKKGMMVPTFEKVAFETEKGKVATVKTQFGTHIIKVMERGPLSENVLLATITKETTPSNKTFQLALTEARHIAESVNSLEELKAIAKEKNMIVNESVFTASSMGVRDVQNSKELVRAAFKSEKEDKLITNNNNSTVFEMEGCYIIAGLKKIHEGEYSSIEDTKTKEFITQQLRRDKKGELLKAQLESVMASVSTLEELADKEGVTIQEVSSVSFADGFISGVGQEPAVVATALLDKAQSLSNPIRGNQGVFVVADVTKEEDASPISVEQSVLFYNRMLQQRMQTAYQALFDMTEITDERYRF